MARLARAHWRRPRSGLDVTRDPRRVSPGAGVAAQLGVRRRRDHAAQVDLAARQAGVDAAAGARVRRRMDGDDAARPGRGQRAPGLGRRARHHGDVGSEARRGLGLPGPSQAAGPRHRRAVRRRRLGAGRAGPRVQDRTREASSSRWRTSGSRPHEALYVGDREDVDVPAAAAAATRCVLIGDCPTIRRRCGRRSGDASFGPAHRDSSTNGDDMTTTALRPLRLSSSRCPASPPCAGTSRSCAPTTGSSRSSCSRASPSR